MNRKELVEQIFAKKSFLCVGLDTDINKLPKCITESEDIQGAEAEMIFRFNQAIIDATAPYCVAYKPNLAFYESRGIDGMIALKHHQVSPQSLSKPFHHRRCQARRYRQHQQDVCPDILRGVQYRLCNRSTLYG